METTSYPQCRIVPIRMLEAENAEKFLDGLSYIPGIRRLLVHGPGYLNSTPEIPETYYEAHIPSSTDVKISEQNVKMHVLMGDVIIETLDERVIQKIADYCEEFFDDFSFQILEGKFIKTEPSLSDYFSKDPKLDPYFVGLSDYKPQIEPMLIKPSYPDQINT
jgi:methyl-coenzyme M reductase subunit D